MEATHAIPTDIGIIILLLTAHVAAVTLPSAALAVAVVAEASAVAEVVPAVVAAVVAVWVEEDNTDR